MTKSIVRAVWTWHLISSTPAMPFTVQMISPGKHMSRQEDVRILLFVSLTKPSSFTSATRKYRVSLVTLFVRKLSTASASCRLENQLASMVSSCMPSFSSSASVRTIRYRKEIGTSTSECCERVMPTAASADTAGSPPLLGSKSSAITGGSAFPSHCLFISSAMAFWRSTGCTSFNARETLCEGWNSARAKMLQPKWLKGDISS